MLGNRAPVYPDMILTEEGRPCASIILAENPTEKAAAAARDLQETIYRMSGALLSLRSDEEEVAGPRILVGESRETVEMGIPIPHGFPENERVILRREGERLVLMGNDDSLFTGTQFAVTMFLEKLGCGWFGPDELWQVIPEKKTLRIGKLDVDHTPQFSARISNVWYNYQKFSERWYMGGDKKNIGHNIATLVSREEYYPTHPEWFAEVNGKRDPYSASDTYWQYCYTNKEFAAEVAKKVIARFDADPSLTNFGIGANDGWEKNWCECKNCALGNDTDELLTFANNVAKAVAKKYPDKKLTILSYHSIYFAPKTSIQAEPNVDVMFCRETSMTLPLDLNLKIPTGYNAITHNTYTQSWLENFKGYIQKAKVKNISIWEWNCIAADKAEWAEIPWVQGNVATRNQKLWKSNGASYVYYDQGPSATYHEKTQKSFEVRWPLWYVSSKGMWDSSLTGEQILQDACDKLFGSASKEMFAYYKALADSSEQCRSTSTICWVPPDPEEVYTKARIQAIDAAVNAAKKKMSGVTADQKKRMENQFAYWSNAKAICL